MRPGSLIYPFDVEVVLPEREMGYRPVQGKETILESCLMPLKLDLSTDVLSPVKLANL